MDTSLIYKKCCFSGYRPSKFPFKLNSDDLDFEIFEKHLYTTLNFLIDDGCRIFYTGMAMGFDILAAETVLYFKTKIPYIKLVCVVPFENQQNSYPPEWKERYEGILKYSDETVVLSKDYHNGCYHNRNKYMVDNSDYVVTWYDGKPGGTRNTLLYAKKKLRTVINLNTDSVSEFFDLQMNINI